MWKPTPPLEVYITYQDSDHKSEERKIIYKRDICMYSYKLAMSALCETEAASTV